MKVRAHARLAELLEFGLECFAHKSRFVWFDGHAHSKCTMLGIYRLVDSRDVASMTVHETRDLRNDPRTVHAAYE